MLFQLHVNFSEWPSINAVGGPMLKKRKKTFISLLILILVIGVSWFALFEYGTRWLKKELVEAELGLRQKGYEVSYSALEFRGTPFSIEAIFHNPHLRDPEGLFNWIGSEVRVNLKPWSPYHIAFTLPQEQKISIKTPLPLEVLDLEGAQGSLILTHQGVLDEASLFVEQVSSLEKGQRNPISLQGVSLQVEHLSHPLTMQVAFTSTIKGLEAFVQGAPPSELLTFSLTAGLSGFKETTPFPRSLAEWRNGGGVLEVSAAKLTWSPISIGGEGTLTLDKDLYPLGAFSSHITGYQEALTHLAALGYVKKNNAATALFVLDMLSRVDQKGHKYLEVPITLQDKRVSVGAVPLFKIGH
jgi:hypothetical protein